jgi:NDP-sugar pyrophosphorylase family protein
MNDEWKSYSKAQKPAKQAPPFVPIGHLRDAGIKNVNVTTHYRPEKITEYFGDGSDFGVAINYVSEERPLGTAGALNLVKARTDPMLVINGDIDFKRGEIVEFTPDNSFLRAEEDDEEYQSNEKQIYLPESDLVFHYRIKGDKLTLHHRGANVWVRLRRDTEG